MLRDYSRSQAVLIGVGSYTHLPPVGAALNSLARFVSVLTGPLCGWPADRISVFSDVRRPGELPDRLVELFEPVRDTALFYYVGHGQVDPADTLCLGLVDSRKEANRRRTTSLPFDAVRHALAGSRARSKIVILDCCYAGLAAGGVGALAAPDLLDHTRGTGAYTLAAAGEFATAWFDTEAEKPQTYFTRYLIDVIEAGLPEEGPELTLESVFYAALDALARDGKPLPTSRATGQATRILFARNAAVTGAARSRSAAIGPSAEPDPPVESAARAGTGAATRTVTGRLHVQPLTGHTLPVYAVAAGTPHGEPIAVSGGADRSVLVWDLDTGNRIGKRLGGFLSGHTGPVHAVAIGTLRGNPIAVSGGGDSNLLVWNLDTRKRIGVLEGRARTIRAVAVADVKGRTVAVSGGDDHLVRVWDLTTATPSAEFLIGHTGPVFAVAFGVVGGRPVAVSGSLDRTVRVWDLASHEPIGEPLAGHTGSVLSVAVATLDGEAVVVSGGEDQTVRVWDPAAGAPAGKPLTGHTMAVRSVAVAESSGGKVIVVAGGEDHSVLMWELKAT